MIYIGENIKHLRREKELTQETLADFLGVTFQSVSKWERGESYPDITMLPAIASFFGVSSDVILGIDETVRENRIQQYIDEYNDMRLKDSPYVFAQMSRAIKEFPGDFRLIVRYLEMLIMTNNDGEQILEEVERLYNSIQRYCMNDTIRMWAKRLVCMYYNTLSHKMKNEKYTQKMQELANEMPRILDSRDYLATLINLPDEEHYRACRDALENEMLLFISTVSNHIYYKDHFSLDYKIEATERCKKIIDTFYDDGNYGICYRSMINLFGSLGKFYAEKGDNEIALKYLAKCAEEAKKHDTMPSETEHHSLLTEGSVYKKTKYGKTMCERMKRNFLNNYSLSDEFKENEEFKKIVEILG